MNELIITTGDDTLFLVDGRKLHEQAGNLVSGTRQITNGAGHPAVVCDLNEAQAIFLIPLMPRPGPLVDGAGKQRHIAMCRVQ